MEQHKKQVELGLELDMNQMTDNVGLHSKTNVSTKYLFKEEKIIWCENEHLCPRRIF